MTTCPCGAVLRPGQSIFEWRIIHRPHRHDRERCPLCHRSESDHPHNACPGRCEWGNS